MGVLSEEQTKEREVRVYTKIKTRLEHWKRNKLIFQSKTITAIKVRRHKINKVVYKNRTQLDLTFDRLQICCGK